MSRPGIGTYKPLNGRLSFVYRDDARAHERGPCHATQEQEEGIMDIFKVRWVFVQDYCTGAALGRFNPFIPHQYNLSQAGRDNQA